MQFLIGFGLAVIISYVAFRVGSLDRSGALAAVGLGTVTLGMGGWSWAILLLAFFLSSSLLTRAFPGRKGKVVENYAKGGPRDAGQVLGNGGLAAIFAGLHALRPHDLWVWVGFGCALAAVNADTWATELGVLSPGRPRLITTLQLVEKGTSGGISLVGCLAALGGASLIGLLAGLLAGQALGLPGAGPTWTLVLPLTLSGLLGSLFDSLLGATVQVMYFCPTCQKETERHPQHSCGTPTVRARGWSWLGNDWVNLFCGMSAVFLGLAGVSLL
jgi:uncharacterized protein (TIGR00297 family)